MVDDSTLFYLEKESNIWNANRINHNMYNDFYIIKNLFNTYLVTQKVESSLKIIFSVRKNPAVKINLDLNEHQ